MKFYASALSASGSCNGSDKVINTKQIGVTKTNRTFSRTTASECKFCDSRKFVKFVTQWLLKYLPM